jgi:dihydroorotate dehydrogenase
MPIIGVGGITDTDTAIRKLDLGAQLVQLYTSLVYEGPLFPSQLTCGMVRRNSWFT